jgi:ABC-type branched-subunit amino acid transport system substrate-binding protein/tetratricopeptide (TPR) repeat protein
MKSRYVALLLLAFLPVILAAPLSARADEPKTPSSVSSADAPREKKKPEESFDAFLRNSNPQTVLNYGKTLFQRRDFTAAGKAFDALLEREPQDNTPVRQQARLWRAKTLMLSNDSSGKAAEHLEQLTKSATDPSTLYEAHFDLGICRYRSGKIPEAAGSFLKVAASAPPYGLKAVRQKALLNLKIIAAASLQAPELAALESETRNDDLKAFFMNERMRRSVGDDDRQQVFGLIAAADTLLQKPSLSAPYRSILESARKQGKAFAGSSVKKRSMAILLPLDMNPFSDSPSLPVGAEMFTGMYFRALEHQQEHPDIVLDIHTRATDTNNPGTAYEQAKQLIREAKPLVIVGPVYSQETAKAAKAAKQSKTPLITPTATDSRITDDNKWCFQLNPTHEERGRITGRELTASEKKQCVAVIAEKSPYLEEMGKGFLDVMLQAGTQTYAFERFDGKDSGLPDLIAGLNKKGSGTAPEKGPLFDALYLPMDSPDVIGATLEAIRANRIGYRRLLGSGIWNDPKTLNQFKPLLPEGITFFTDYALSRNLSPNRDVTEKFRTIWDFEPGPAFWYGYDAFDYLLHFLVGKNIAERQKLADALFKAPPFRAHYTQFHFNGGNVNTYLNVFRFTGDNITRIR